MLIVRVAVLALVCVLKPVGAMAAPATIGTVAGGGPEIQGAVGQVSGLAVDGAGNSYVGSISHDRVYRISSAGTQTTIAGVGSIGYNGDGIPATSAAITDPAGLAVDTVGNVYIADAGNHRIRRVDALTGGISTVAGSGAPGFAGDGGAATSAQLNFPRDVAVDSSGNLFIADTSNHRVRRVDAVTGVISVLAGTGVAGYNGDGFGAATFDLNNPTGVAVDGLGDVYIADSGNNRIRRVSGGGVITTIAGDGLFGFKGDGGPATAARLRTPAKIAVDSAETFVFSEINGARVRRVAGGVISTILGTGIPGFNGDGIIATAAQIRGPVGVALNTAGDVFVADQANARLRRVSAGIVSTVGGNGMDRFGGDGFAATLAQLHNPNALARDASGALFIADSSNNRVRRVDPLTGVITTVAGNDGSGYDGDGLLATDATLNAPFGVALDASGNLFIGDSRNARVRRVDAVTGIITTVAGTGVVGYDGDGIPATLAQLGQLTAVVLDSSRNLFIADGTNSRIRRVDAVTGVITTVAGKGDVGLDGDGILATLARLRNPLGVAVDALGNIFIPENSGHRIRRVDAVTGLITTVAGTGVSGFNGDGLVATDAQLESPIGIAVDAGGTLYISERGNRVRSVDAATLIVSTVAGIGSVGFNGDGIPAITAQLTFPSAVMIGDEGLFISDTGNHRVRLVDMVPPAIAISTPANGAKVVLNTAAVAAYGCTDPSGIVSCAGPVPSGGVVDTTSVGAKMFTVSATDGAGNSASLTHTYNVVYAFTGFFAPIDNVPVLNVLKAGAAVTVKFRLGGNQSLDVLAPGHPRSVVTSCDSTAQLDVVEETVAAGGSSLTYDAIADQYVYVWKTEKSWANACRQLVVKLRDGTEHRADFKLK
jgi:sugar lactone lactonase YvrE